MNNEATFNEVKEIKVEQQESKKVIGSGQARAMVRLMEKMSWQANYYKDTPMPKTSRQVKRAAIRKIEKMTRSETKRQLLKGN